MGALVASLAMPALAQDIATRPYVFTQGHNGGAAQTIDTKRGLQVQLPSDPQGQDGAPVVWEFVPDASAAVKLTGVQQVDSPGRIAGLPTVTVFDFIYSGGSAIKIAIKGPPDNGLIPGGKYLVTLTPN